MNHVELKEKIHSAAYTLLQEKNYVSPIEVLIKINILSVKDYEDWRFGRVQYLEKVCKTNLSKLSFALRELRIFAQKNNLKPSKTVYKQWGTKGKKILLRFSKSGTPNVEESYATHFVGKPKEKKM